MAKQGVAITGMGIISSIGTTVEENLQALLSSKKELLQLFTSIQYTRITLKLEKFC